MEDDCCTYTVLKHSAGVQIKDNESLIHEFATRILKYDVSESAESGQAAVGASEIPSYRRLKHPTIYNNDRVNIWFMNNSNLVLSSLPVPKYLSNKHIQT